MLLNKRRRRAFLAHEKGPSSPADLGGKGAALKELNAAGIPTPAAFTVTTGVARAFAQHGRTPKRLANQLRWGVTGLEKETGKRFGDPDQPLLVSVRSGAPVSMPGMMDTVLNLGMNAEVVEGLAQHHGRCFALDCYQRFLRMFGEIVLAVESARFDTILSNIRAASGLSADQELTEELLERSCSQFQELIARESGSPVPEGPWQQLGLAVEAVLRSWNNPRAVAYRESMGISHGLGTAVTVQEMVFGNMPGGRLSATGVAFSRDCSTGEPGLWGEFLANAQGEDIVSGKRTPRPVRELRAMAPELYGQLESVVDRLEQARRTVVDVEWTVEDGRLYVLQVRAAKLTPKALAKAAVHFVWEKKWTKEEATRSVAPEQVESLQVSSCFDKADVGVARAAGRLLAQGLPASPGAAVGRAVRSVDDALKAAQVGEKVILVRPDTSPDDLPAMLPATTVAILTQVGGATCHAAVVARGLGKPCVVGCGAGLAAVRGGETISVDGAAGMVFAGELPLTQARDSKEASLFLKWAVAASWPVAPRLDFETVKSQVNAGDLAADFYLADGMARAAAGTKLARAAARLRTAVHSAVAERIATYFAVAVGGEVRHVDGHCRNYRPKLLQELKETYKVLLGELGADRYYAQVQVLRQLSTMDRARQAKFFELAATLFEEGDWEGSYGGPRWAAIARAAHAFLCGKMPHSVFADHAFDLQHNSGSVFGKHSMLDRHGDLECLLECKKHSTGLQDLRAQMMAQEADWGRRVKLSQPVQALLQEGECLGLW